MIDWVAGRLPTRQPQRARVAALLLSGAFVGAVPTLLIGLLIGSGASRPTSTNPPARADRQLASVAASASASAPASIQAATAPVSPTLPQPATPVPLQPVPPSASGLIATVHSDPRIPEPVASAPHTPSCAELGARVTERLSDVPGAAFLEIKRARKGIVQGDVEAAQVAYCRALAIDPDEPTAHAELARIYMLRRDATAALSEVRAAIRLSPSNRVLSGIEADALARLGDHKTAREGWCAEAGVDPSNPRSLPGLAETFLAQARNQVRNHAWNEAERLYRRAAVLVPDDVRALVGVARALAQLGELDRAALWAKAALDTPGLARTDVPELERLVARAADLRRP